MFQLLPTRRRFFVVPLLLLVLVFASSETERVAAQTPPSAEEPAHFYLIWSSTPALTLQADDGSDAPRDIPVHWPMRLDAEDRLIVPAGEVVRVLVMARGNCGTCLLEGPLDSLPGFLTPPILGALQRVQTGGEALLSERYLELVPLPGRVLADVAVYGRLAGLLADPDAAPSVPPIRHDVWPTGVVLADRPGLLWTATEDVNRYRLALTLEPPPGSPIPGEVEQPGATPEPAEGESALEREPLPLEVQHFSVERALPTTPRLVQWPGAWPALRPGQTAVLEIFDADAAEGASPLMRTSFHLPMGGDRRAALWQIAKSWPDALQETPGAEVLVAWLTGLAYMQEGVPELALPYLLQVTRAVPSDCRPPAIDALTTHLMSERLGMPDSLRAILPQVLVPPSSN